MYIYNIYVYNVIGCCVPVKDLDGFAESALLADEFEPLYCICHVSCFVSHICIKNGERGEVGRVALHIHTIHTIHTIKSKNNK